MSDERKPLWSDERIRDRYHALVPCEANMGEMEYWNTLRDVGERVSYELRDEYEGVIGSLVSDNNRIFDRAAKRISEIYELRARITELEAQLAQRWQPLPDGVYDCQHDSCKVTVDGEWLQASDELYSVSVPVALLDNIRLCRLVTQEPTL